MPEDYHQTRQFHGASFRESDLNGATFRDCDLRNVRIASSWVDDMRITGFDGRAGIVTVDDVVVTEYVTAELDRRHPERVQVRQARTADEVRAAWATLEDLWALTVARAEALPEERRQERVEDEWSVTETLRHLVFAIDSWVGNMLLGEPAAYHRLGLAPTDFSADAARQVGMDVGATPSWREVLDAHAERRAKVRDVLATLRDEDLEQPRTGAMAPGEDPETVTVGHCLRVILNEHCEHRRFAVRDLAVLEAGRAPAAVEG
jgi:uncharacterized damage-inducible protein DinB